jgi:hypothetical protein
MKRRAVKKQISQLTHRLFPAVSKYLAATSRVHQDVIYSYEREIEFSIVDLMGLHLILDPV